MNSCVRGSALFDQCQFFIEVLQCFWAGHNQDAKMLPRFGKNKYLQIPTFFISKPKIYLLLV